MVEKAGVKHLLRSPQVAWQTDCVIRGHCRTHVFEFPKKELVADGHLNPVAVVDTSEKRATVVSDLQGYFRQVTPFRHFKICHSFRSKIDEAVARSQRNSSTDRIPLFVVVEQEVPCEVSLEDGTCFAVDQGRIFAWEFDDAPWPAGAPEKDRVFVDTLLAAVKIVLGEVEVIREFVEASCFFDDKDRVIHKIETSATMNLHVISPLTEIGVNEQVDLLRTLLTNLEAKRQKNKARIDNLVGALRLEEADSDSDHYRRSWYLSLYEATDAMLSGDAKQKFKKQHKYRNRIGHPRPSTKMDMDQFWKLQRDALAELRRLFLPSRL